MAATAKKYPLGSPQEHIEMCKTHDLPFDMICEDCEEFICGKCAKTDHKDHEWNTIPTAATKKRRGLLKFLKKIKEEDLLWIDEKIEKTSKQITENKEVCAYEIKKLQKHIAEIINRLTEVGKYHEKALRDNLIKENDPLNHVKSELEKKKRRIVDTVEFMEKNNSTMSDYSLIDNHRELSNSLSELKVHMTNCEHSLRFIRGEINDEFLKSVVGRTGNLDGIGITEKKSFQNGNKLICVLATFSEDRSYINELESEYIEQVSMEGTKKQRYSVSPPNDMCVTDNGDVYFTDADNNSISCLSPSGSVSAVISTDPLVPIGICMSVDGGLLVSLADEESDSYELQSQSRRLVRHITVTGDVIDEYEYQEDGHTRLFTWPYRVTQNSNSDICVVNSTSPSTGVLFIMSPSGRMKSVYRGQNLAKTFTPTNVVCDSSCNILVTDYYNNQIHLLSPHGKFLKFLLTDEDVNHPRALSLYKSTLWVGYQKGLVKVFTYRL